MTAPTLVDFSALLAPIAEENPCGDPVPYDVKQRLEDLRKEDDPDRYPPDDPARPETFRKADWPAIVRLAEETLTRKSKDLLVVARMTEAHTRLHGFQGLCEGLRLMRELSDKWWDQVYPVIEDGDLDLRAGPFNWLDDSNRGALFPNTVYAVPLVTAKNGAFGWLDWKRGQDGRSPTAREEFDKAVLDTTADSCAETAEQLDRVVTELDQLRQLLDSRMGQSAPGLNSLRQAVTDCQTLIGHILREKRPTHGAKTDINGGLAAPSGSSRPATSREEAYRQLSQAAAVLQELEPHSPIPYLVRKAVELGTLTFPELIAKLIRDESVLGELNRELGIKPPQSS